MLAPYGAQSQQGWSVWQFVCLPGCGANFVLMAPTDNGTACNAIMMHEFCWHGFFLYTLVWWVVNALHRMDAACTVDVNGPCVDHAVMLCCGVVFVLPVATADPVMAWLPTRGGMLCCVVHGLNLLSPNAM